MKEEDFLLFLTEDLKDTSIHLRETDRKLATWTQIYGGFFLVAATLFASLIDNQHQITDIELLGTSVFFLLFTFWLFTFSLRSMEMKTIYLNRMNFLRQEIHGIAKMISPPLKPGFWTGQVYASENKEEGRKRGGKVNLDDLYPVGLTVLISLFSLTTGVAIYLYTGRFFDYQLSTISICAIAAALFLGAFAFSWRQYTKSKKERTGEKDKIWGKGL